MYLNIQQYGDVRFYSIKLFHIFILILKNVIALFLFVLYKYFKILGMCTIFCDNDGQMLGRRDLILEMFERKS